jgi:hypothetical protein
MPNTKRTPKGHPGQERVNLKVNTMTKSPKHDEFVVQLIFVVFRCRFCDTSVQKWAILTWLMGPRGAAHNDPQ